MPSSKPGTSLNVKRRVSRREWTRSDPLAGGKIRCSFSSMEIPILANGSWFGESKASSLFVLILVVRHARSNRSWKKMVTSFIVSLEANMAAMIKLRRASLYDSHRGIWPPVKTTGLPRFSKRNDRAVAQYAMVSVPMSTTKPSKCK